MSKIVKIKKLEKENVNIVITKVEGKELSIYGNDVVLYYEIRDKETDTLIIADHYKTETQGWDTSEMFSDHLCYMLESEDEEDHVITYKGKKYTLTEDIIEEWENSCFSKNRKKQIFKAIDNFQEEMEKVYMEEYEEYLMDDIAEDDVTAEIFENQILENEKKYFTDEYYNISYMIINKKIYIIGFDKLNGRLKDLYSNSIKSHFNLMTEEANLYEINNKFYELQPYDKGLKKVNNVECVDNPLWWGPKKAYRYKIG